MADKSGSEKRKWEPSYGEADSKMSHWKKNSSLPEVIKNWAEKAYMITMQGFHSRNSGWGHPQGVPEDELEFVRLDGFHEEFGNWLRALQGTIAKEGTYCLPVKENQSKLQLTVPPSLYQLFKAWSISEGRELTSVVLQAAETGIRQLKVEGKLPLSAVSHYEETCQKRLAVAELNALFDISDSEKKVDDGDSKPPKFTKEEWQEILKMREEAMKGEWQPEYPG